MSKSMMTMKRSANSSKTKSKSETWSIEIGFERFMQYCQIKNLRPKTIKNYVQQYERFKKFVDNCTDIQMISDLTQYDLDLYVLDLKQAGIRETSINSYLRGIRALLNYWFDNKQCGKLVVRMHKADKVVKETYSDDELCKILQKPCMNTCDFVTYRNWVIINFFLATGVRVSTLVHIKIEDLDLNFGRLVLTYTKTRKTYIVPVSAQLKHILEEYLNIRGGEPTDYLFCNQYGDQMTTNSVRLAIERYNRARGVEKCGLHAFRHTFAKRCVMNGVNVFVLQRLMGHSDISVTKEYIELYADDLAHNIEQYNPLDTLNQMSINRINKVEKKRISVR